MQFQKQFVIGVSLLACLSVGLAHSNKNKKMPRFKITNISVKTSNPAIMSTEQCQAASSQHNDYKPATSADSKKQSFYMTNFKFTSVSEKHGVIAKKWRAETVYVNKNGKKFTRKAYGAEVGVAGNKKVFYGSFDNGICRGFYKKIVK